MAKMSDKTKRAINRGRRKAGLKPIKFGSKKKNIHPITKKKRMTRNELEQKELENLNRNIPQFDMVNLGKASQRILDSMKKRQSILRKKY